jgi:hypothetical protein
MKMEFGITDPLKVLIHTRSDTVYGSLRFMHGEPILQAKSGDCIKDENSSFFVDYQIIVGKEGISHVEKLPERMRIKFNPVINVKRPYGRGATQAEEDMWPLSSEGWFGRVGAGVSQENLANCIVQEVEYSSLYWLSIVDSNTGAVYEFHPIRSYEMPVLALTDNWEHYIHNLKAARFENVEERRERYRAILEGPQPSWDQVMQLTHGFDIPNLNIGSTMRETLKTMLPAYDSKEGEEQVMLFLAWLISESKEPFPILTGKHAVDPVDLVYELHRLDMPLLKDLLTFHIWHEGDGTTPPTYIPFLHELYQRKGLDYVRIDSPSGHSLRSELAKIRLVRGDKRLYRVIPYIKELEKSGEIVTSLPVTRKEARESRQKWFDRLACINSTVKLACRSIRTQVLGLQTLLHIGRAHKWPHKHMYWSATIESSSKVKEHIQVMILPPSAAEQVLRKRKRTFEVEFSAWNFNYHLYYLPSREWRISIKRILSSLDQKTTLARLEQEFGKWRGKRRVPVTREEAVILDYLYMGIDLDSLEAGWYPDLTENEVKSTLERFRTEGLANIRYYTEPTLYSLLIVLQGDSARIYSAARGLLRYSSTALCHIGKGGDILFGFLRLPLGAQQELVSTFESTAAHAGLTARCLLPDKTRIYSRTFYQNLLREDGTWNDDVSDFLEQART